jgi:hypothetical protein
MGGFSTPARWKKELRQAQALGREARSWKRGCKILHISHTQNTAQGEGVTAQGGYKWGWETQGGLRHCVGYGRFKRHLVYVQGSAS